MEGGVVLRANESLGGGGVGKLPEAFGEEVIKGCRRAAVRVMQSKRECEVSG